MRIRRLRLTVFGAMAHIDNPYSISTPQLFAVSIAGPTANMLVILITAAMCHWRLLAPFSGAELMQINLILMLFNLLPALPLDGGRMLYALLTQILSRRRALELGIFLGRLLAVGLILLSFFGYWAHRYINLSPIFAAVFLLSSARDERQALTDSHLQTLMDCMHTPNEPIPVTMIAINADTPAETALRAALPDRVTLFAVYDHGHFSRIIDDRTILSHILKHSNEGS